MLKMFEDGELRNVPEPLEDRLRYKCLIFTVNCRKLLSVGNRIKVEET